MPPAAALGRPEHLAATGQHPDLARPGQEGVGLDVVLRLLGDQGAHRPGPRIGDAERKAPGPSLFTEEPQLVAVLVPPDPADLDRARPLDEERVALDLHAGAVLQVEDDKRGRRQLVSHQRHPIAPEPGPEALVRA